MKCSLLIMNVEDYTIVDKEGVVTNSFNIFEYHDKEGMITIDTNIPTQFEIKVTSLHMQYVNHGFRARPAYIQAFSQFHGNRGRGS